MQVGKDMVMEKKDTEYILLAYLRSYKFFSKGVLPIKITIPIPENLLDPETKTTIPIAVEYAGGVPPSPEAELLTNMPEPTVTLDNLEYADKAREAAAAEFASALASVNEDKVIGDPVEEAKLSEADKVRIKELQSNAIKGSVFEGPGAEASSRGIGLNPTTVVRDLAEDDKITIDRQEAEDKAYEEKPAKKIFGEDGSITIKE